MTEAAAPAGATSDLLYGSTALPTPASPQWRPENYPVAPAAYGASEAVAARARIEELKADTDWVKRWAAGGEAEKREFADLHRAGFPSPAPVDVASQNAHAVARSAEQWNSYVGWLKQRIALTPEMEAEVRNGVVREETWRWARDEKDRLVKDRAFYRRLMDGDRKATEDWERIKLLVGLRPMKMP
jgi:hypothetical protein